MDEDFVNSELWIAFTEGMTIMTKINASYLLCVENACIMIAGLMNISEAEARILVLKDQADELEKAMHGLMAVRTVMHESRTK